MREGKPVLPGGGWAKLIGKEYVAETRQVTPYEKKERGPLELPDKAENMKRAYWYLVSVRGISPQIVSHFMNRKMIYQEKKYGNCVFVGYDSEGAPGTVPCGLPEKTVRSRWTPPAPIKAILFSMREQVTCSSLPRPLST